MTVHQFKYYLHDDYQSDEMQDFLTDPQYGNLPADVAEKIVEQRPFYEIELDCEYNTETGAVTMLKASRTP